MKPLIILNPRSGGGRTGALADDLLEVIRRHLGEVDTATTAGPRHAVELAETACREQRETVVAVGGDGTVHEIVNGLLRGCQDATHPPPRLGIVGRGTGGDFRRTLGLDNHLEAFCRAIASGRTRTVDVGRFTYATESGGEAEAHFMNILSVGMGGLVDRYVARTSKALGGTAAYFGATLRALLESRVAPLQCTVEHEGAIREVTLATRSLAICNGQYFGSGMRVAPMAQPDDGLFHVISLGAGGRARFALSSLSIYSGRHVDNPAVTVLPCSHITIDVADDDIRQRFPLDVDGEPFGLLPIDVHVVPGALEVFVGPPAQSG